MRVHQSEEWMTKVEIAAHLKCTPRYINTLMRRGILPYLKMRGLLRFDPQDCSLALQRFKTRSRFGLDSRPASEPIIPARLEAPHPTDCPRPASGQNGIPRSSTVQTICAKAFDAPEEAREYLDEIIRFGGAAVDIPTNDALRKSEKASITVIILQSTPVLQPA
jgi:hypothetical protein